MFGKKKQRVEVSVAAYHEIVAKLIEAGVNFNVSDGAIDMSGIEIAAEPAEEGAAAAQQPASAEKTGLEAHRPLSTETVKIPRGGKACGI